MNRFLAAIFLLVATATAQERLATASRLSVKSFRFEGNTVFSAAELAGIVTNFTGRELTREDLEDARRAVTLHYTQAGYINSGAVLPDQPVAGGVVLIRIVEGRLTGIQLTGNHWLRAGYLTNRVARWASPPLNVNRLKDGLQLLRQNPNLEQINADLRPGPRPGESTLDLRVKDQSPFRVGLQVDNARPPSVDSTEVLVLLSDRNLTGHGDPLEFVYGIAEGGAAGFKFSDFDNVAGSYTLPVGVHDTTVRAYGDRKDFAIVEQPFDTLDIRSSSYRYGAQVRQPFWQTANQEFALGIAMEHLHAEQSLLGQPFDFPGSGSVSGRTDVTALCFSQEWTHRTLNQVVAARSTFGIGVDWLGTTPGTDFLVWRGQFRYVRRLFQSQCQLILRTDVQWTGDKLVSSEQFPLGGINSVRGYLENQLVRDRGVFSSVEVRIPVLCNKLGAPVLQLAPFYDFGGGWNVGTTPAPGTITSAGIGLLVTPCRNASACLYWGHGFRNFKTAENDPQDLGLSFRVTVEAF